VLLAAEPPGRVSARNVIETRVLDRADAGNGVLVTLDASGEKIVARVTAAAVRELSLAPGVRVYAVVKAHSLTILGGDDDRVS
jgi:molybdate transport system ATP-binding protein